jgi:hypothetical protein
VHKIWTSSYVLCSNPTSNFFMQMKKAISMIMFLAWYLVAGDEVEVDDVEEEDIDDVVSVEEALGVEEGIHVENLAGVITILGDSDADEEGNLDDNGYGFYYRFHTCAIYGV